MRQFEGAQQVGGAGDHLVEDLVAVVCLGDGDQFDLSKLVLADDAAGIAPGGTRLFAEAGGVARHLDRQLFFGDDLVVEKVRQRHFRRWDKEKILILGLVEVVLEFRQLSRPLQRAAVDEFGDAHLRKAAFAVEVEHEVDERALQARPHVVHDGEAAVGDLDAALEVDPAVLFGQFPVLLRGEIENARREHFCDLDVVVLVRTVGNVGIGHVRDAHRQRVKGGFRFALCLLKFTDTELVRIELRFELGDIPALFFVLREEAAHFVLGCLRLLESDFGRPEGFVARFELVEQFCADVLAHQCGADTFEIFLKLFEVDHLSP